MRVAIRDATRDDAGFIAWAIQEAGRSHLDRGTWDIVLPMPESERLRFLAEIALAEARSFCHYGGFLIAEVDGQPISTLSAYVPREANVSTFIEAVHGVFEKAGWSNSRIDEILARFGPLMTCAPKTPDEAWVVEWVATLPAHRGRGHANRLLEAILERGRDAAFEVSQIGVYIGNTPAQAAYEKVGFEVVEELRHPDFEAAMGCPGVRRMLQNL